MKRKIKLVVLLILVVSVGLLAGDHLSKLYAYVEAYEMGNVVDITIDEEEIADYTILDGKAFGSIDQEVVDALKTHMKENNLKLRCGSYELSETYTYDEVLEVFEFE